MKVLQIHLIIDANSWNSCLKTSQNKPRGGGTTAQARKDLYKEHKPHKNISWGRGEFLVYRCKNAFNDDSDCVHCICRYCGVDVIDSLTKKRGELRPAHNKRCEVIQNKYRATEEKEDLCNHRWDDLQKTENHNQGWWEDKKKTIKGTKCAEYCVLFGEKI